MTTQKPTSIEDYINGFPENVQIILQGIRQTLHEALPDAEETMSYGMPTFDLNGHHLVYFSAWKDHIGLYPLYTDGGPLKELLLPYKKQTNSIHPPYADPFPYEVIRKFAAFRKDEEEKRPSHK